MITGDAISINRKCERAADRLIAEHQTIIIAWYDCWIAQQKARADKLFPAAGQESRST